jgi:hypothetical protein
MFNVMVGMVIGGAVVWFAKDKVSAAFAWIKALFVNPAA